jgi:hypothetical protein
MHIVEIDIDVRPADIVTVKLDGDRVVEVCELS